MKKALIITYYWPPAGGGGVQRVAKFCKYLGSCGWKPVVLTVRDGNFPHLDDSLQEDTRGIEAVYRAATLEPHTLFNRMRSGRRKGASKTGGTGRGPSPRIHQLGDWVRLNLFVPDSRIGWRRNAVREGIRAIQSEQPSLIFSSAPPYTVHLIARDLHKRSGLPWIADFRDPWFENLAYNTAPRLGIVKRMTRRMEQQVLETADRVVTVGRHLKTLLGSKLDPSAQDKIHVITNGYDADDIPDISTEPDDVFRLSYYGTVYRDGFPEIFVQAVAELAREHAEFGRDYSVELVGKVTEDVRGRMIERLAASKVRHTPYIPHDQMMRRAYQPQVLLLFINDVAHSELILTGKLFDYLPTGNPILAVGPRDGDAAAVLRKTGTGNIFEYGDTDGIKDFLRSAHSEWKEGKLNKGIRRFPEFERADLTKQLVEVFEKAVD